MLAGVWLCGGGLAAAKGWLTPLPVGISFYLLQAIAYIIDCYRGDVKEPSRPLDYALYMSFFPRLSAGPIVRAEEFLPQLSKRRVVDTAAVWEGLVLICFGLFKKLVIADNLAIVVDPLFADLHVSPSRLLLASYGFAVQIYCDFSGYTDVALGTARLFGYRLPENFNWPYLSRNPADFWRRWHISLSNWLRDYIYFSLPGQRSRTRARAYVNFSVTMLLCGIWHGFGWTYAAWGLYHGLLLASYYSIRLRRGPRGENTSGGVSAIASILLMQQLAVIGWILFRVNRISDVATYAASLFHGPFFTGFSSGEWFAALVLVLVACAHGVRAAIPITKTFVAHPWNPWLLMALFVLALATVTYSLPQQQTFLYFRF
jgi:alginate O-acetyltransferase complex protein AlgI